MRGHCTSPQNTGMWFVPRSQQLKSNWAEAAYRQAVVKCFLEYAPNPTARILLGLRDLMKIQ